MNVNDLRELCGKECVRLAKLGSCEAIAQELASRGMAGTKEPNDCPLARGLCDTLMISTGKLFVFPYGIAYGARHGAPFMVQFGEEFSPDFIVLSAFVNKFDDGAFPFLECATFEPSWTEAMSQ